MDNLPKQQALDNPPIFQNEHMNPWRFIPHQSQASPRLRFQWMWFLLVPSSYRSKVDPKWPGVLNVGCADDPLYFGEGAVHYDLDDWSAVHKYFVQGDAHELPFPDQSFHTVICGDLLEHALDPMKVAMECTRVAEWTVVFTVFEEWKLPGYGQFIKEGAHNSDVESRRLGYKDREDYQQKVYPERIGVDDDEVPHLIHINQFADEDMHNMVSIISQQGFAVLEYSKTFEAVRVEDQHPFFNWLIAMRRMKGADDV
jgi:hypothetical protein